MHVKVLMIIFLSGCVYGAPIIFNTNPFGFRGIPRGFATVRPVTTLNTVAVPPRNLVPPAPAMPVRIIPRVFERSPNPRAFTAPKIVKTLNVLPLPSTVPTFTNIPRNGANSQYNYSYGVSDPRTGDSKHAEERSANGVVRGSYSLTEPDGSIRRVTYTADNVNGFNAVVERVPANPTFFRQ